MALSDMVREEESFTGALGPCWGTGGSMEMRLEDDILKEGGGV